MKRKIILIILVFIFNMLWVNAITVTNDLASKYNIVIETNKKVSIENAPLMEDLDILLQTDLSYNGEDAMKIAAKIDKVLKNEMAFKGEVIAKYSIANEVNPYLVAAMIEEATGCDSECDFLVKKCNNVAGIRYNKENLDEVSCYGGYYRSFLTIDDSIRTFIKYVKTNFYDKDLTTPLQIYKEYKKDVRWAFIVNENMNILKNPELLEQKKQEEEKLMQSGKTEKPEDEKNEAN